MTAQNWQVQQMAGATDGNRILWAHCLLIQLTPVLFGYVVTSAGVVKRLGAVLLKLDNLLPTHGGFLKWWYP